MQCSKQNHIPTETFTFNGSIHVTLKKLLYNVYDSIGDTKTPKITDTLVSKRLELLLP